MQSDILSFLLDPDNGPSPEFVMEVTDKTRADVKVSVLQTALLWHRTDGFDPSTGVHMADVVVTCQCLLEATRLFYCRGSSLY